MFKRFLFLLLPAALFAEVKQPPPAHPPPVITPAVGPFENNTIDYVANVEFLYWYATATNLAYANEYEATLQNNAAAPTVLTVVPRRIHEMDWSWNPGVRLGLGVVTNFDGWDVYLDWTYTYNSTSDSTRVSSPIPSADLTDPVTPVGTKVLGSPWMLEGEGYRLTSASSRWSLLFNQFDLELGRRFWISNTLILRPYGGLRVHWSRMYFRVKGSFQASNPVSDVGFQEANARRHQKFWGVGLLAGIETSWFFLNNWGIFGDLGVALLYGPFDIHGRLQQLSTNFAGVQTSNISIPFDNDDIYSLQPVYDLSIGLRWEIPLRNQDFRARVDLGWESHFMPNYNHLEPRINQAEGDLSLMGVVLRGRFEF